MKKLFSIMLCFIFLLALLPYSTLAANREISISSVVPDYKMGTVSVSGSLSGYYYSPWRKATTVGISVLHEKATADSVLAENSQLFHIDDIEIDENSGEFAYTFEHKVKEASDDCIIYLSCEGYESANAHYTFYSESVQNEIMGTLNAICSSSPLYYVSGEAYVSEKIPYKFDGDIYIPFESAAKFVGGMYDEENSQIIIGSYEQTGEYITAHELSDIVEDINVNYESGIVYKGAELTDSKVKSIVPMFGIHVSKDGSDSASGTANAPVNTINRALELYHTSLKNKYIFVHSGTYEETVVIDDIYSDLTLKAVGDVKLMPASIKLDKSSFSRVTDSDALSLIPDSLRGVVLSAKISGCTDASTLYKVFSGEEEQPIARFPNGGGFEIADGSREADSGASYEPLFYSDREKLELWGKDNKARAILFRNSGYQISKSRISATQPDSGTLHLSWESGGKPAQEPGKRFFVYDTLCELDMQGEWYIDREKQRIYYYPEENFEELSIVTSSDSPLNVSGATNITIDGFEIRGARKNGVVLDKCDGLRFTNCTVRNVGTAGINATALTNSRIENCIVKETGEGGIRLNYKDYSSGKDPDLAYQGNTVTNCTVHHVGVMNPIAGAVYFGGTGNTFSNNTVHDTPHMGIWFLGNDNVIEYNDFYNTLKYCDDAGVIYGNPGITGFGNVIRYNRIRDFESLNPYHGEIYMIYLDADTSGVEMKGNIIDLSDCAGSACAAMIGGGRNNVVEDNIIIGSSLSGETNFWMSDRYNRKRGSFHSGLLSSLSLYKFINSLTDTQREKWFSKYSALEEEYSYYVEYLKGDSGNDPKGAEIGVARDCIVKNNVIVNEIGFKADNDATYLKKMSSVFGPPESDTGLRYEIDESTGNVFLSEYDTSDSEAMKAGAISTQKEIGTFSIKYPKVGDVLKSGPVRFVWRTDGSHSRYNISLKNEQSGEEIFSASTVETFASINLLAGKYTLTVTAGEQDSDNVVRKRVSFEAEGDKLDVVASIDLSDNKLRYTKGETGKISVSAFDYDGNRTDMTGGDGLTYKTSDNKVVTVSNDGTYTVQGQGSAVISVRAGYAESSMMIYCTADNPFSYLTLDNYETYKSRTGGKATRIDDPMGYGYALKESADPQLFSSTKYTTYAMGIWVYDSLSNSPRFGIKSSADNYSGIMHEVFYGVETSSDTHYHLRHHHNDPTEISAELSVPRSKGWHQIFMTVEYDGENDLSYVEFYFDGKLVVRMVNNCKLYLTYIRQSAAPFKERLIADVTPSPFALVSTSVDSGEEVVKSGEVTVYFNKPLNNDSTTLKEAYFTASDGTIVSTEVSISDSFCTVAPVSPLSPGVIYKLTLVGSFVNRQTPLLKATTLDVSLDKSFKVREDIKMMKVSEKYTASDGKTILEVNIESLLKEGKQSVLLITSVKNKEGVLTEVSVETLTLNPLETVTRQISGQDDSLVEAYVWDSNSPLLPLENKITNIKEKE